MTSKIYQMTERYHATIRPFRVCDAKRVSEIVRRCLTEVNAAEHDPDTLHRLIAEYNEEGALARSRTTTCLVAEIDGEVAGTGGLCGDRLVNVFVDPDLHGRGIGRSLVLRLEEIAMGRGISAVSLLSSRSAVHVYLKLGYEPMAPSRSGCVRMRKSLRRETPRESSLG